ncbi:hypothetical protein SADUNF_Sadunf13G0060800 [Salix dunnii]|uniref:Benzyl alcohol O-benzoyltransferase n=1 Tax=Salix dunnii TaxID=1413687 RepID=A0A835JJE3_9ROSI|nr:hypothetical protein SADUNF_Sadunf13G0060800 [Salix dunnii]
MTSGVNVPSVPPVWDRHVLNATDPPRVADSSIIPPDDMAHRSFLCGPSEISALRKLAPPHLSHCSTFEILTACVWICRTIDLHPDPTAEMRMVCLVNSREKFNPPLLPRGYYGNGLALPVALATAGELPKKSFGYALESVRKAKASMTMSAYFVSDLRRAGIEKVDFGCGNAICGGVAKALCELSCFYIPFTNKKGEDGIVVPFCLPSPAMERFFKELEGMLKGQLGSDEENSKFKLPSSL